MIWVVSFKNFKADCSCYLTFTAKIAAPLSFPLPLQKSKNFLKSLKKAKIPLHTAVMSMFACRIEFVRLLSLDIEY